MYLINDRVAIEQQIRSQLFNGAIKDIVAKHNDGALVMSGRAAKLSGMLMDYAALKVDEFTGQSRHSQIGKLRENMRDIAQGDATTLLRLADAAIDKALAPFRGHRR